MDWPNSKSYLDWKNYLSPRKEKMIGMLKKMRCSLWKTPMYWKVMFALKQLLQSFYRQKSTHQRRGRKQGGTFSLMYSPSFRFLPLLTHVQSIFLSLNGLYLFSLMYSPSQYAVPCLWKNWLHYWYKGLHC